MDQQLFQIQDDTHSIAASGAENHVFDFGRHRADLETRFPNVDDVFEKLSSDPRVVEGKDA